MTSRHTSLFFFIGATLALTSFPCLAIIDQLQQRIATSDFEFERSNSEFPFLPIGALQTSIYDVDDDSDSLTSSEYTIDQFFGAPVWVGQKNMLILGESLSKRRIRYQDQSFNQYKSGLVLGFLQQTSPQWQWGGFSYIQHYNNKDADQLDLENSTEMLIGGLARYKHQDGLYTWYGLVYDSNSSDSYWLPYFGLEWLITPRWLLSFIPPWPSISYISEDRWIYRFGIMPGQTRLAYSAEENTIVDDFSYWNAGFAVEKGLVKHLWIAATLGYSGVGRFTINDNELNLDSDLSSTPFFKISLNFRPE